MPVYEYRCNDCGHSFAKLQSLSALPLTTCPQCSQESLVKLVSAPSCDLKGVGVFGSSKQPFKNESACATGNNSNSTPCASCPHAAPSN